MVGLDEVETVLETIALIAGFVSFCSLLSNIRLDFDDKFGSSGI